LGAFDFKFNMLTVEKTDHYKYYTPKSDNNDHHSLGPSPLLRAPDTKKCHKSPDCVRIVDQIRQLAIPRELEIKTARQVHELGFDSWEIWPQWHNFRKDVLPIHWLFIRAG
jgi:hypothetical protein